MKKKCSTSFPIMELQIKTAYHYKTLRMAKIQKAINTKD